MDIRPVDVQMFINKSSQIDKNENREQKGNEQFQMFSEHFQKTTKDEMQKTIETNKSEDRELNKDRKGNKRNKETKENKGIKASKEKENSKENKNKNQGISLFDISI